MSHRDARQTILPAYGTGCCDKPMLTPVKDTESMARAIQGGMQVTLSHSANDTNFKVALAECQVHGIPEI